MPKYPVIGGMNIHEVYVAILDVRIQLINQPFGNGKVPPIKIGEIGMVYDIVVPTLSLIGW